LAEVGGHAICGKRLALFAGPEMFGRNVTRTFLRKTLLEIGRLENPTA
jgi:hypothetical protein